MRICNDGFSSRHCNIQTMENNEIEQKIEVQELPDSWWYRVYIAVIITTILVISALWTFSKHFSS